MAGQVLVLYGSQTGNAEDIAKGVVAEAARRGYTDVQLAPMNEYEKVCVGDRACAHVRERP
jgi:sulfite reductase alpha subunit-like flavoprotein